MRTDQGVDPEGERTEQRGEGHLHRRDLPVDLGHHGDPPPTDRYLIVAHRARVVAMRLRS
jgi:hypothetical protein